MSYYNKIYKNRLNYAGNLKNVVETRTLLGIDLIGKKQWCYLISNHRFVAIKSCFSTRPGRFLHSVNQLSRIPL